MSSMSIGQIAKSAQVGVDTVRFYEKRGLLPHVSRRASGYRQYHADDLRRLRFIRRAKELGFSLEEIGTLLMLRSRSGRGVAKVKAVAHQKLLQVDGKIAELQRLRTALAALVAACPGQGMPEACPILRAFETHAEAGV